MKAIQYLYQENEIHFLVNPQSKNVMINATEMAKIFNKDVREFLKLNSTYDYINAKLKKLNNDGNSHHYTIDDLYKSNKKAGTYMLRPLALKFAAWLDTEFEVWIFDTIDELIFGHYKKHWEAHAQQEAARIQMESLKPLILKEPTPESVAEYFQLEREFKEAKTAKSTAIRNQLKLF